MFASPRPRATLYCSVHGQLFCAPLQAWLPVPCPHVHAVVGPAALTEVACPTCEALALRTLQAQFPALYTDPSVPRR